MARQVYICIWLRLTFKWIIWGNINGWSKTSICMIKILLFSYFYEYRPFQCERLSPFKCSLSRLIHTNECTAELERIRFTALFQACRLKRTVARKKKLMTEITSMKNVWMFMMTTDNKNERNDWGKCIGWPVTSYGSA